MNRLSLPGSAILLLFNLLFLFVIAIAQSNDMKNNLLLRDFIINSYYLSPLLSYKLNGENESQNLLLLRDRTNTRILRPKPIPFKVFAFLFKNKPYLRIGDTTIEKKFLSALLQNEKLLPYNDNFYYKYNANNNNEQKNGKENEEWQVKRIVKRTEFYDTQKKNGSPQRQQELPISTVIELPFSSPSLQPNIFWRNRQRKNLISFSDYTPAPCRWKLCASLMTAILLR